MFPVLWLAPGFVNLPEWVEVLESTVPRSVIAQFQIHSSKPDPELHLLTVTPHTAVFETPIVNPTNTSSIFTAQVSPVCVTPVS